MGQLWAILTTPGQTTTVEAEADIGPVGTKSRVYFSHNFLVLMYSFTLVMMMIASCGVSAIERGIRVRIIFDVRLRTVDAKLSAAFGIADLAVALATAATSIPSTSLPAPSDKLGEFLP